MKKKKEIILIRHGKACSLDAFHKDIDRVLMERGVNDGYRVAEILIEKGVKPDIILTSPAARANHTALIFSRALNTGTEIVKIKKEFFHCSDETFLNDIYSLPDNINSVMIVAHNPGITDLAYELTKGGTSFLPTSGVAVIQFDTDTWPEISRKKPDNYYFIKPKEI